MVLGTLTIIFGLLSFYGTWLYIRAIEKTQQTTYALIAGVTIGELSSKLCSVWAVVSGGLACRSYIAQIVANASRFVLTVGGELPIWLSDGFTLSTFVCVLCIPFCVTRSVKVMFWPSVVELVVIAGLLAHNVYWMTQRAEVLRTTKRAYFEANSSVFSCLRALCTAYAMHPIAWLHHSSVATGRTLRRVFIIAFIVCGVVVVVFGLTGYLANPRFRPVSSSTSWATRPRCPPREPGSSWCCSARSRRS
jgi:hypothetical protein